MLLQCNEGRTDDAPSADVTASNPTPAGKKGSDAGVLSVMFSHLASICYAYNVHNVSMLH